MPARQTPVHLLNVMNNTILISMQAACPVWQTTRAAADADVKYMLPHVLKYAGQNSGYRSVFNPFPSRDGQIGVKASEAAAQWKHRLIAVSDGLESIVDSALRFQIPDSDRFCFSSTVSHWFTNKQTQGLSSFMKRFEALRDAETKKKNPLMSLKKRMERVWADPPQAEELLLRL